MSTRAPARDLLIPSLEGLSEYDVHWPRDAAGLDRGVTAVLRVRNEAHNLPWTLPPLLRSGFRIVVVDNGSDDGTADVARRVAQEHDAADRVEVTAYPFRISRCGDEHLQTHERSVHSLAHFYNWSFAHVRTAYSLKWDGDMVLTDEGVATFADLAWQLEHVEAVISMPRHPLFVESSRVAYLDRYLINVEEYLFPMGEAYRHVKAFEWEMRMVPRATERLRLPEGLCVELKHLDSDEFDHWDGQTTFGSTERTRRKAREWQVFSELRAGRGAGLAGVERIEAPAGQHVVDYVAQRWLPAQSRPLTVPPHERAPEHQLPAPVAPGSLSAGTTAD